MLDRLFGAVNRVAQTTDLIEKKQLLKFKIHCLILQTHKNSRDYLKENYQEEITLFVLVNEEIIILETSQAIEF